MTVFSPPAYATIDGTTGYTTLATAVTSIGSTNCTLILPSGAHIPPATIPGNIQLQFANGAYLDTTGFLPVTDIEGLAAYGTTDVTVTVTGHPLVNGDRVTFYGITASGWDYLNNKPWVVTGATTNTFRLTAGGDYSGFAAYVPATDPGKVFQFTMLSCSLVDTMNKIFEVDSPAISFAGAVAGGGDVYNSKIVKYRPEWWGAKGDVNVGDNTGTDNIIPFRYCLQATCMVGWLRHFSEITLTGRYYLSDTWGFSTAAVGAGAGTTNYSLRIKGCMRQGTGIVSGAAGYPALEFGAWFNTTLEDVQITGVNNNGYPTVGIWLSRIGGPYPAATGECNDMYFNRVQFDGTFQYGCIYNANAEVTKYTNIHSVANFTQNYAFVYAGVGGVDALDYFPSIVPKFISYDPTGTGDSCTYNHIKSIRGITSTSAPYSSLIFLGGAQVHVDDFYYSTQTSSSNVFNLRDNCTLMIRGEAEVEGVPHADVFNVVGAAAGKEVKVNSTTAVYSYGNYTGLFANVDSNSKLIYYGPQVELYGTVTKTSGDIIDYNTPRFRVIAGSTGLLVYLPTGDLSAYLDPYRPSLEWTIIKAQTSAVAIVPGAGNFIAGGGGWQRISKRYHRTKS